MMNKGTLISLFISTFILNSVTQTYSDSEIPASIVMLDLHTHDDELNQRCIPSNAETKSTALQTTVDQIVQHVSILMEGRPNSKKNIVAHLAAILSSIINLVAKMVACHNKQRDSFYHELDAKLQKVLAEYALEDEMHEIQSE